MSTTDHDRVGLGWEIWLLIGALVAGGGAGVLLAAAMAVGFDAGEPNPIPGAPVSVEPGRLVIGAAAAVLLLAVAGWIIRSTDWRFEREDRPGKA